MKLTDWLLVVLTAVGVLLIPALGLLVRSAQRATRTADRLSAIAESQRRDHESMDKRLRFMEEYWMRKGIGVLNDGK